MLYSPHVSSDGNMPAGVMGHLSSICSHNPHSGCCRGKKRLFKSIHSRCRILLRFWQNKGFVRGRHSSIPKALTILTVGYGFWLLGDKVWPYSYLEPVIMRTSVLYFYGGFVSPLRNAFTCNSPGSKAGGKICGNKRHVVGFNRSAKSHVSSKLVSVWIRSGVLHVTGTLFNGHLRRSAID